MSTQSAACAGVVSGSAPDGRALPGADRDPGADRAHLARELHDVLGHHVSLINLHASVALRVVDERPDQVRTALTTISRVSADLLQDMRAVLGILRQVGEPASVDQIADLVRESTAAGVETTLTVHGPPRSVPPDVSASAYRVVQEALTNVRRHSDGHRASAALRYQDDGLVVQVDDDGTVETGPAAGGSGLVGLRDRVTAVGGSLTAGPRAGGGWRVTALLPTRPRRVVDSGG